MTIGHALTNTEAQVHRLCETQAYLNMAFRDQIDNSSNRSNTQVRLHATSIFNYLFAWRTVVEQLGFGKRAELTAWHMEVL